jgi:hypothetical protein
MMESTRKERRSQPRVPTGLAAQFADESGGSALAAETIDLSVAGVCCRLPSPVEPLTKVRITLLVPDSRNKKQPKTAVVTVEGIVVRSEPAPAQPETPAYEIACAFTTLKDKDRKILQSYVDGRSAGTVSYAEAVGSQGAGVGTRE